MKNKTKATLAAATLILAVAGFTVAPAQANDIAPFTTVFDTDVEMFGVGGIRTNGTGTIDVTGITGTVTRVDMFWHGPTNSADPLANATVMLAGTAVTGTNIGLSSDNCWGFQNSQAYQADVTSLVPGNGSYAISDFVKTGVDINGVSLVIFYNDGDTTNNRDFVMFDGNDSNTTNTFDADGWNVTLAGINYTTGSASMDLIVSDGQTFPEAAVVVNGTEVAPAGGIFQGDSVPNAGFFQGLWDVEGFDVTTLLTPGANTLSLTTTYQNDCLSLIMAAVNIPAGSAPGQPTTTTTSTTEAPTTTTTAPTTLPPVTNPVAVPVAARPTFTG